MPRLSSPFLAHMIDQIEKQGLNTNLTVIPADFDLMSSSRNDFRQSVHARHAESSALNSSKFDRWFSIMISKLMEY